MGCSFPSPLDFLFLSSRRWSWRKSDLLDLILRGGIKSFIPCLKSSEHEANITVLFWVFCSFSQFSSSFPPVSLPRAFFCPEPPGHTAQGNPCKQRAAAIAGLSESSCQASDAGPLRLNMAPESKLKEKHSLLFCRNITKNIYCMFSIRALTIWQRERLSLTSFSSERISISSFPSKAFILSCLLANLEERI